MQGTDLLDRLVAWRSPLVVVIMSGRPGSEKVLVEEAFRLGMNNRGHCIAYLHKPLLDGSVTPIADRALAYAARWANRKQRERLMIQALLERITPAELFVMEGVLKGLTSADIAAAQWAYLQRHPAAPKAAKEPDAPEDDNVYLAIARALGIGRLPPPEADAGRQDDADDADHADLPDADPGASRARWIKSRTPVVEYQRFHINKNEARLKPLNLRIEDFEALLDERFDSLQQLIQAEITMRMGLLTPPQRIALGAAMPRGNKAPRTPALTEALQRICAADVKAVFKWHQKVAHLQQRAWVWPDSAATAADETGTNLA